MIVDIPDKGMKVEFPDDMDMKEVERHIMAGVYNEDTAYENSVLQENKELANQPDVDIGTGSMTPEIIDAIPDQVVRAFAKGRVSVIQKEAVEKAVSAQLGAERQTHLDNLIAINAKIAETKKIAENLKHGEVEER